MELVVNYGNIVGTVLWERTYRRDTVHDGLAVLRLVLLYKV
jgi:hypothetical protein